MNIQGYTEFIPPRQCPVFEPNEEEFKDPLAYIAKIRPIGEKFGICKIKPPAYWQPPFAVNIDKIKFTPRLQRLNELEATTRIKLNFLDQIAKFWDLQGCKLRIPQVDRKALDLYSLFKAVKNEGGYNTVLRDRKWAKIAVFMGYSPTNKYVGGILKQHYEKILLPYDLFKSGESLDIIKNKSKLEDRGADDEKDKNYTPHAIPYRQSIKPEIKEGYTRRTKRVVNSEDASIDFTSNNELKRLQFFGAGPKLPGVPDYHKDDCKDDIKTESCFSNLLSQLSPNHSIIPKIERRAIALNIENVICNTCGNGDDEEFLLLCENCDLSFHTFCLMPPLKEVPKGDWRCPLCISKECKNNLAPFGFEQSCKEYTLHTFGEMADEFKATYFNMPFHMVPTNVVEKEFWRLVSSIVEDVTVCYGADLHCIEHGSGFPTDALKDKFPADEEYIYSPWNLNNLPVLNKSILKYISGDISGMKVPWMYVGMCFSTFCWHTEDHWSYSINYLHWGEPKTWYGVPGSKADALEEVMKAQVPELFEAQNDLLHQLVTLMNPNILMAHGVPVSRADQYPGEFMVTFPRAYHAGFNQGYNLAEAVNFCPSDWIPVGRKCISHYRTLKRYNVFSHEELMCKMAACPEHLELSIASATYDDMLFMIDEERRQRKEMFEMGVTKAEREIFELLGDDERKCDYCNTTCFLSALSCICLPSKMTCLHHFDHLCTLCSKEEFTLKYRYTLDELPQMMKKLKAHVDYFDNWALKVKESLEGNISTPVDPSAIPGTKGPNNGKTSLDTLKDLYKESLFKKFPSNDLTAILLKEIERGEACAAEAKAVLRLVTSVKRMDSSDLVTLEQLKNLGDKIKALSCSIEEEQHLETLLSNVTNFKEQSTMALNEKIPDVQKLEELIECKLTCNVLLPEREKLREAYQVGLWLVDVRNKLAEPEKVTVGDINELMVRGRSKPKHPALEKCLKEMHEIVEAAKAWEEKAKKMLISKPSLTVLENFMVEIGPVPIHLPNITRIKEIVSQAKLWLNKAHYILNGEMFLSIPSLQPIVGEAHQLSISMSEVTQLESLMNFAKAWRDRAVRCFLKKNSQYTFEEVICPRTFLNKSALVPTVLPEGRVRKRKYKTTHPPPSHLNEDTNGSSLSVAETDSKNSTFDGIFDILGLKDAIDFKFFGETIQEKSAEYYQYILQAYQSQQTKELECMHELRARNLEKYEVFKMDQLENSLYFEGKDENGDGATEKFCICNKPFSHPMLCCQLCKDWFHYNCVLSPKFIQALSHLSSARQENITDDGDINKNVKAAPATNFPLSLESKYLCPACIRSRRPKLETAFSLLVSLQKIPLKTHEILILQCLTERAVKWQERVQKFLTSEEISSYISACKDKRASVGPILSPPPPLTPSADVGILSTPNPTKTVVPTPKGTVNTINTTVTNFSGALPKCPPGSISATTCLQNLAIGIAATDPTLTNSASPSVPSATGPRADGVNGANVCNNKLSQQPATLKFTPKIIESITTANFHPSLNGHLSITPNNKGVGTNGIANTPTPPALSHPPAASSTLSNYPIISGKTLNELEYLMIEGDLIELTLHETQYLWQIYRELRVNNGGLTSNGQVNLQDSIASPKNEAGDMTSVALYLCNPNIPTTGSKKKSRVNKATSIKNNKSVSTKNKVSEHDSNFEEDSLRSVKEESSLNEDSFQITPSFSNTLNELGIGDDNSAADVKVEQAEIVGPTKKRRIFVKSKMGAGDNSTPTAKQGLAKTFSPNFTKIKKMHQHKFKRRSIEKVTTKGNGSLGGKMKIKIGKRGKYNGNRGSFGGKRGGGIHRNNNQKRTLDNEDNGGGDREEYGRCSLPACQEPVGSDINWVQCDGGCEQWFHMACVGLSDDQVSEHDDYYCYRCKEKDGEYLINSISSYHSSPVQTIILDQTTPSLAELDGGETLLGMNFITQN